MGATIQDGGTRERSDPWLLAKFKEGKIEKKS